MGPEPSSGQEAVCMCFSFVFECVFVCVFVYPVFVFCLHHGRCECGNVVVVKVQRVGVNQSRFLGAGLSLGASQPEHNWTSHWIQGLGGFLLHFHLYLYFLLYFYLSLGTRRPEYKRTSISFYEYLP